MRDNVPIYNSNLLKEMLRITCSILGEYFYYDKKEIKPFLDDFADDFVDDLTEFMQTADPEIIDELKRFSKSRFYFTCYFTSEILHRNLVEKLHFSEQELLAFENILPKYTGERSYAKQKHSRTHD
jgi:hypothetical protein